VALGSRVGALGWAFALGLALPGSRVRALGLGALAFGGLRWALGFGLSGLGSWVAGLRWGEWPAKLGDREPYGRFILHLDKSFQFGFPACSAIAPIACIQSGEQFDRGSLCLAAITFVIKFPEICHIC
jgi:hypothetical protein